MDASYAIPWTSGRRRWASSPRFPALLLHVCGKAPPPSRRESSADFELQLSPDGQAIAWSLQFRSRAQYHAFLNTTPDGAERAKVRELIAAGMRLHHIVGCSTHGQAVTKLADDGLAFVGSCPVEAHATPAGGI
jgi:hypothetical protein